VLSAVERSLPDRSHEAESRIEDGLLVEDVQAAPPEVLGVLASGGRFRFSFDNVATYVEARGVDDALLGYLEDQRELVMPDDTPPDRRDWLATQILEAKALSIDARVTHVAQLVQEVAPTRAIGAEPELVVALVKSGLLADNAATFQGLSRSVEAQETFLVASKNVADFITSIGLTEDLAARVFRNESADRKLKQLLADNLPTNPSWQGTDVYEALADWLRDDSQPLYSETARLMVESGASAPARALALTHFADRAGFDAVAQHVHSLGEPYSLLLERSHSSVEIPKEPDFRKVLDVLRNGDHGPVSSWYPTDSAPDRVWMRHPIEA
jgi:hypothetical protein